MATKSLLEETFSVVLPWQWYNNKQKGVNALTILIALYVKQAIGSKFLDLVSRVGLSKTHVVKSKFH